MKSIPLNKRCSPLLPVYNIIATDQKNAMDRLALYREPASVNYIATELKDNGQITSTSHTSSTQLITVVFANHVSPTV